MTKLSQQYRLSQTLHNTTTFYNTLHNLAKLFKTLQRLCNTLQDSTTLYNTLTTLFASFHDFTQLYKNFHRTAQETKTIRNFTQLYTTIHRSTTTKLFTTLENFHINITKTLQTTATTWQHCTQLDNALQNYTHINTNSKHFQSFFFHKRFTQLYTTLKHFV